MIPVEVPLQRPIVFLQSLDNPATCFVSLPVRTINPDYGLRLSEEDRASLLLDERELSIGGDVLCLALLVPFENRTANGTAKVGEEMLEVAGHTRLGSPAPSLFE